MTDDRHHTLIREGWLYDGATDRYKTSVHASLSYTLTEAWQVYEAATQPPTRSAPIRDPRKQEPQ